MSDIATVKTPERARLNFATDWSYAPAPESAGHVKLKAKYDLFINGKFVAPSKGRILRHDQPRQREETWRGRFSDRGGCGRAVKGRPQGA